MTGRPKPCSSREHRRRDLVAALSSPTGARRAHLVEGPGGIGKSHLLRELAKELPAAGLSPVLICGSTIGADIPLGAFAGVGDRSVSRMAGEASPAARLISYFAQRRSSATLLVDNVDALDPASLFTVAHLIRSTHLRAVVATRRLTEAPEAIRELYDHGSLVAHTLPPLSETESVEMAERVLGGRLTPGAAAVLAARAEGNPLHLRELVRGSLAEETLVRTPHGWELNGPLHPTGRLTQLIGSHLHTLPAHDLALASILGAAGTLPASALDPYEWDRLLQERVVEETDGWLRLAHPLYDEALRARFPDPHRRRHRERAAELLAFAAKSASGALSDDLSRRSVILAVECGDPVPTDAAVATAEHAHALMRHELALRIATRVLESAPGNVRALSVAGRSASALGELALAERHLDRALECARTDSQISAAARAKAHHLGTRRHRALDAAHLLQEVLERVDEPVETVRVEHDLFQWRMVGGLHAVTAPPDTAVQEAAYAHALVITVMATVITGPLDEVERLLRRLEEVLPRHREQIPAAEQMMRLAGAMASSYTGDVIATRGALEREIRSSLLENPQMRGTWEYALGLTELLADDVDRAHALAEAAVAHLRWRDPMGLSPAAYALASATSTAVGRPVEAEGYRSEIAETSLADPKVRMQLTWARAWRERASGRTQEAAVTLAEGVRYLLDARHVFLAGMLAHCAVRLGHPEPVAKPVEEVAELAGGGLAVFIQEHLEAVERHDREGLADLFARASDLGMRATAADTALTLARWSLAEGDRKGAHLWNARAARIGRGPALWSAVPDRSTLLTRRESEVAFLAARRLTSKEIAHRLGSSPNTVNNQLAAVYRKLGVRDRAELRGILFPEGEPSAPT
ncbi:helix-turn-helix domain-containing protein [Nocardiopsis alkaliphila]|uniref:helix-turn-helix domain-containing protein n=1 Tax=Nocardiopsis alkaliphila TaxID=225762 RepID=UPI000344E1D3|nr:helix-turn-helix transcriptional regulator [Nocardiopsis alkaliphila]